MRQFGFRMRRFGFRVRRFGFSDATIWSLYVTIWILAKLTLCYYYVIVCFSVFLRLILKTIAYVAIIFFAQVEIRFLQELQKGIGV